MPRPLADAIHGQRAHLAYLHPGTPPKETSRKLVSEGVAGFLRLARERQGKHRPGLLVEHIVAGYDDGAPARLLPAPDPFQVSPADLDTFC